MLVDDLANDTHGDEGNSNDTKISGKQREQQSKQWKEKEKAGKALVTPDLEHKYNLPEGVRYELQGEGLIIEEKTQKAPFSNNPLDTLNSGFMDKE